MAKILSPQLAAAAIHSEGEVAFVDVRELGQFADGHPLFAVPCPFSRLEGAICDLVPRRHVPVLLIDAGDGIAERAAAALADLGYTDIAIVEGGTPGWTEAGLTLFQGVNVPSKVLGELVEAAFHPRQIDAVTLASWQEKGQRFHLFDCRPPDEFERVRVPGSVCLPNGELAHRYDMAVTDHAPVVVTCAGRTRGLVGAAGLALAGISDEAMALTDGTQGWALAGLTLERGGRAETFPALDDPAATTTRARADQLMTKAALPRVTAAELDSMRAEDGRTVFLFDVRSKAEAEVDPLPAFTHAPVGQLVQATDQWVGVRRARLVLADDFGLRGALGGYWLRAMGYDAQVLAIDDAARALAPIDIAPTIPAIEWCGPNEAISLVRQNRARLLDLRRSDRFRSEHVTGTTWGVRPRFDRLPRLHDGEWLVLGEDERHAAFSVRTLLQEGHAQARGVRGGYTGLIAAGAPVAAGPDSPTRAESIDFVWFAHGRHDGDLDASRQYLAWEHGLIAQLNSQERAEFTL